MKFSTTEIQTYQSCPQKWHITSYNRMGLEPIVKAPALALGILIHKTKEDWSTRLYLDGLAPDSPECDPRLIYQAHANEALAQIVLRYREQVGTNPGGAELLGVTQAINLGADMIENYLAYWGAPVSSDMRLIKPEQTIQVPIPGTEHVLESTLDGLMIHKHTNVFYILENKTFAAHPNLQELARNFQFLCYTWLAREFFKEDVRGLAYDGLWKRAHIPTDKYGKPRQNKATGEPYKQDDLFLRTVLTPSPALLESLPRMLAKVTNDMANEHVPQPDRFGHALHMPVRVVPPVKGCVLMDKQNIALCDAIWRNEDTSMLLRQYTKRDDKPVFVGGDEDEAADD